MNRVIIVGSGGAALSCAIVLKQRNIDVTIITKTMPSASATAQAQGGINAALNKNDSIQEHIKDTMKAAKSYANEDIVKFMCENAPETIKWLDDLGVAFSRDTNNNIAQRFLGGASHKRACYSSDYTGLKILHTLYDIAISLDIQFIYDTMLLNIIKDHNEAKGITALDLRTMEVKQFLASKIIIATGGYAGVYLNHTTNSNYTTSDGISAAINCNIELQYLDFIQFHPTALKLPNKHILISESARGEGGILITSDGKRFVDELAPRDVVAKAIYDKIKNKEDVFLDLRKLGYKKIISLMPQEYKLVKTFTNLELDKDIIPIIPSSHYSMGGIKVNKECETSLTNLYAIGEVSCNTVHGINRLGGNSLLEIITFGKYLGTILDIQNVDVLEKDYKEFIQDVQYINTLYTIQNQKNISDLKQDFGNILYHNVGIDKNKEKLLQAKQKLLQIEEDIQLLGATNKEKIYNIEIKEIIEFKNMVTTAKEIVATSLERIK